jgi:hypothetical protein
MAMTMMDVVIGQAAQRYDANYQMLVGFNAREDSVEQRAREDHDLRMMNSLTDRIMELRDKGADQKIIDAYQVRLDIYSERVPKA